MNLNELVSVRIELTERNEDGSPGWVRVYGKRTDGKIKLLGGGSSFEMAGRFIDEWMDREAYKHNEGWS